jgi:hypothetical protein
MLQTCYIIINLIYIERTISIENTYPDLRIEILSPYWFKHTTEYFWDFSHILHPIQQNNC